MVKIKIPEGMKLAGIFQFSGEGGIRTLVPLRETRSPGVRARPDYATSPVLNTAFHFTSGGGLYHER